MKQMCGVVVRGICGSLVLALLGAGGVLGQQSDSTGSQQQQQSQQDQNPEQDAPPAQSPNTTPTGNENPNGSGVPQGPLPAGTMVGAFRQLGFARDVLLEKGPVRLGPIFVTKASGFFLAGNGLQYDKST